MMTQKHSVNWKEIKAVVFDVDGTLYKQSRMRKKMLLALLSYYLVRPWRIRELLILRDFRIEREKRSGYVCNDLENAQYKWCADKGNYSQSLVKHVVEHWMFDFPNQYLSGCVYPGVESFFESIKKNGLLIAVYSDYKADDKLKAMGLEADLIVCSTDPHIDRLKPDPAGILYIANQLNVKPEQCLFIGDRHELDGKCAINAGSPYLIVDKKPFDEFDFFKNLQSQMIESLRVCKDPQDPAEALSTKS